LGGDPTGDGTGGPGYKIKAEFNKQKHDRGVIAMARSDDPDSAGSQFYITLVPAHFLDGKYTVFGKVVSGMNIVDNIKKGDKMTSVRIVEIRSSNAPSATPRASPPPAQERNEEEERLVANYRRDLKRYRDTLGPVLQMFERELARQIELHKAQKDLYEKGAISAADVRAGERALAAAQKDVDDTRRDIKAADRMMGEIELAPQGAEGKPRVPR
jgi:cyclophilin family peptidyl-prolyl cis-trans isomerase